MLVGGFYVLASLNESDGSVVNQNESDQRTGEDFIFTSVDGNEIHLSTYRGKIVVLDMWATWCNPCLSQIIELQKIYNQYSRDTLEIFSVDIDPSETLQQIKDFRDSFKLQKGIDLNWILGKDDGSIWQKYMISGGIPTLCIFDQEGKLFYQNEGLENAVRLSQKIDDLLD